MQLTVPHISQPLKLWEKIEIIIGDGDNQGHYISRIEDFNDDGIVITKPEFTNGGTLLKDNDRVSVIITKDDAVYQFSSQIHKMTSDLLNNYILSPPADVKRVQRRQFVRIEMTCRVDYVVIDNYTDLEEIEWLKTKSLNVSGGGMLIHSPAEINKGDKLLIKSDFFLKTNINQPILAHCCRSITLNRVRNCGIEFILNDRLYQHITTSMLNKLPVSVKSFNKKSQEQIVSFIFREQLEMRKKGIL